MDLLKTYIATRMWYDSTCPAALPLSNTTSRVGLTPFE